MKHIVITALLAILGTGALAQTNHGTVALSGGLSISSSNTEQSETSDAEGFSFGISPQVGYFIADNLELGVSTAYSFAKNEYHYMNFIGSSVPGNEPRAWNSSESKNKQHTYTLGFYLKKYFMLTDKVAIHGTSSVYYTSSRQSNSSATTSFFPGAGEAHSESTDKYAYGVLGLNLSPGITFFPSEKIGLGASFGSIGYSRITNHNSSADDAKAKSNSLSLNLSSASLVFGFSYYISR